MLKLPKTGSVTVEDHVIAIAINLGNALVTTVVILEVLSRIQDVGEIPNLTALENRLRVQDVADAKGKFSFNKAGFNTIKFG